MGWPVIFPKLEQSGLPSLRLTDGLKLLAAKLTKPPPTKGMAVDEE